MGLLDRLWSLLWTHLLIIVSYCSRFETKGVFRSWQAPHRGVFPVQGGGKENKKMRDKASVGSRAIIYDLIVILHKFRTTLVFISACKWVKLRKWKICCVKEVL